MGCACLNSRSKDIRLPKDVMIYLDDLEEKKEKIGKEKKQISSISSEVKNELIEGKFISKKKFIYQNNQFRK